MGRSIIKENSSSNLVMVYEPPVGRLKSINWRELWDYRELLYFLTWRDVKVRYKQAALGVAWAILQPLFTMIIFSVIFGSLVKVDSEGIPYPVFSFAALLPWQFFSGALSRAGGSLVMNNNLLTKIYFPRLVIPLSAVGAGLVDFGISFVVLLGLMLVYGITPTWAVLTLPFFILLSAMAALAVGLWLSALNVQYRDVQYLIPFIVQVWMYASPVVYSAQVVPQGLGRIIYGINPMAGVIQGFRWALLGTQPPDLLFLVSVAVVIVLLITGLIYFRQMEDSFADIV
jgi:lipopolysaccharide transport system permease protein